ncbi:ABC transporter ATP-binding protein [Lentilactobacillus raoultii]|uniref:ABC transporter ATP-binding protein n=1 Tax=Lentilactobacillus raoultii TaxID=1987503 RepID=A0ABW3PMP1_9LACO|nr:ABC transporter ATP-binding protein [Lentilactobacillus raoultii]
MTAPHLRATHLTFGYTKDVPIIKNISMSLPPGKLTAIIGRNGSGKSTLFKCLTSEVSPQVGTVYLNDKPLADLPANHRARQIAIVHQKNQLSTPLSVRTVVGFGRTPYRRFLEKPSKNDERLITDILKQTKLTELADRSVLSLSGGQLQRVWLALALAQDPQILLLDEPTTYLDINTQLDFLSLIRQLVNTKCLTVGAILHDMNQVLQFADNVLALADGQLIADGPTAQTVTPTLLKQLFGINATIVKTKAGHQLIDYP